MDITNELLELTPHHERAAGNKVFYEKELEKEAEQKADKMLRGDDGSPDTEEQPPIDTSSGAYTSQERQMYEKLCRGESMPEPHVLAKLKCRYVTKNSPFLTIAPLKLEEASLKPYIVVYHDVMYDNEIELIKQMAKPRVNVDNLHLMDLFPLPHFCSFLRKFQWHSFFFVKFSFAELPSKIIKLAN